MRRYLSIAGLALFCALGLAALFLLPTRPAGAQQPASINTGGHFVASTIDGMPSGMAVMAYAAPVATATTGLGTITASSGSNSFTGVSSPDVCRQVQVTTGASWDGGSVTLTGTDCSGLTVTFANVAVPGATNITSPMLTITSATKSAVGVSSATVTLGPGDGLGLATRRRRVKKCFVLYAQSGVFAVDANPTAQSFANTDPYVLPTNLPNGLRAYHLVCSLL